MKEKNICAYKVTLFIYATQVTIEKADGSIRNKYNLGVFIDYVDSVTIYFYKRNNNNKFKKISFIS